MTARRASQKKTSGQALVDLQQQVAARVEDAKGLITGRGHLLCFADDVQSCCNAVAPADRRRAQCYYERGLHSSTTSNTLTTTNTALLRQ